MNPHAGYQETDKGRIQWEHYRLQWWKTGISSVYVSNGNDTALRLYLTHDFTLNCDKGKAPRADTPIPQKKRREQPCPRFFSFLRLYGNRLEHFTLEML